jgi:hypothetical protein
VAVLFSGRCVLTLRIKSTVTNSKHDPQGRTARQDGLSRKKLAIALVAVCAFLMAVTVLYALVTVVFAEINPVAVAAAVSVAVAGIAWFRKASFHK